MKNLKVTKLQNGITLLMERIPGVESVCLGVFVRTGAVYEKPEESGVSHYLEHMMFKGTKKRTAKEISEAIDREGGMINAYTSKTKTVYYVKMLPETIKTGIDILSDILTRSIFPPEELEKERNVIIEEIHMYEDIPEETIHDENARFALAGVYGNSVIGTEASLKGITEEAFRKYHKETYTPENMLVSVAGKIEFAEIQDCLERQLGKYKNPSPKRNVSEGFTVLKKENIIKKKTNQIHLCVNTRDLSIIDDKWYVSAVIGNTMGGGMSSRLFQKVREDLGLAYAIYAYGSWFPQGGLFTVYAGTTKKDWKKVARIVLDEFKAMREKGVTAAELAKSKNQIMSGLIFGLENTKNRMERMANSWMLMGRVVPIAEVMAEIRAITRKDVMATAEYMFDEAYYSTTVLGDIR
ncbi:MAG: insulinase family protein [Fusobacteriaceae bacterium]|jgi:predicted Zn-dependent peptidase|nr:insulinase family protein [Fusobacteriaceae bacterium]